MGREVYLNKIAFVRSTMSLDPHMGWTANMHYSLVAGPLSLYTHTVGHRVCRLYAARVVAI